MIKQQPTHTLQYLCLNDSLKSSSALLVRSSGKISIFENRRSRIIKSLET
jgi:hypothetical protein